MNEQWCIEIETKITYQEKTLEALQEVVYEHEKTIETLKKDLKNFVSKLDGEAEQDAAPANEKPPHY